MQLNKETKPKFTPACFKDVFGAGSTKIIKKIYSHNRT